MAAPNRNSSLAPRRPRRCKRERTSAGIQAARRAGKKLSRPAAITDEQWTQAMGLMNEPHAMSVVAVAGLLNVSRQAIYKRLSAAKRAAAAVP